MNSIWVKIKRTFFTVLATLFLGIGCIRVILPVLPTTPFLLLAVAGYVRRSKRVYPGMMNNRIFGSLSKIIWKNEG